ncbi:MAG: hypothetical protein CSB23_03300 [Deltaproteobacteria bacterium]|nr:MAG: hypothetical protein CSB23_03300 [Deltaproteobacteria bacterium]
MISYAGKSIQGLKTIKNRFRNRFRSQNDKKNIVEYLAEKKIKKLHIGCGRNFLDGWLNSDLSPNSQDIISIDATAPFPFKNETFDYIFSEHMIEHISYPNGLLMLNECYRILKNSGAIRISTPDLFFLIDLYGDKKTKLQEDYIKWATDNFVKYAPCYDSIFVINNFVRDWGHLFIYDEKTLRASLKSAGFKNVVRCNLNESANEALCGLENENRMPEGFLKLESITLEGEK